MEVVASIASVVQLAGFVLKSSETLYFFLLQVRHGGQDLSLAIDELRSLIDILKYLKDTIRDIQTDDAAVFERLFDQVYKCGTDMEQWHHKLTKAKRKASRPLGSVVIALKSGSVDRLRSVVRVHREQLNVLLAILIERNTDVLQNLGNRTFQKLQVIQKRQISDTASVKDAINQQGVLTQRSLGDVATQLRTLGEKLAYFALPTTSEVSEPVLHTTGHCSSSYKQKLDGHSHFSCAELDASSTGKHKTASDNMLVRLVKIGKWIYEEDGKSHANIVSFPDPAFSKAAWPTKVLMIKQCQHLRLLMWLLQRDHLALGTYCFQTSTQSLVIRERFLANGCNIIHIFDMPSSKFRTLLDQVFEDYSIVSHR